VEGKHWYRIKLYHSNSSCWW